MRKAIQNFDVLSGQRQTATAAPLEPESALDFLWCAQPFVQVRLPRDDIDSDASDGLFCRFAKNCGLARLVFAETADLIEHFEHFDIYVQIPVAPVFQR